MYNRKYKFMFKEGRFTDFNENRFEMTKTKLVPMDCCDITTAQDQKPLIGTTSLASCAGIAIYDTDHKIGGVAHVFFNEKMSIAVYQKDCRGMYIPSTGRAVIVDNPAPFAPFSHLLRALVQRADEVGGNRYRVSVFNVRHGCRTSEQNLQLQEVAERVLSELSGEGKVVSVEYRNEQAFQLDTRNGNIRPLF